MNTPMDFVLANEDSQPVHRESYNQRTTFGAKLKRSSFPTECLALAQRFRWVEVGKCLKPTKQYVVTSKRIDLKKGKPKLV